MDEKSIIRQIALKYGLLLGFGKVLVELLNYNFGDIYKRPGWVGIVGFALFIGLIIMAIKEFKTANNGYLKVGQAVKTGLGVSLIAAIIGAVYMFVFLKYIEPGFIDNYMQVQEQVMLEAKPDMSEEDLELAMSMARKFTTTGMLVTMTLAGTLLGGLFYSFIAGLIMQKKEELA